MKEYRYRMLELTTAEYEAYLESFGRTLEPNLFDIEERFNSDDYCEYVSAPIIHPKNDRDPKNNRIKAAAYNGRLKVEAGKDMKAEALLGSHYHLEITDLKKLDAGIEDKKNLSSYERKDLRGDRKWIRKDYPALTESLWKEANWYVTLTIGRETIDAIGADDLAEAVKHIARQFYLRHGILLSITRYRKKGGNKDELVNFQEPIIFGEGKDD